MSQFKCFCKIVTITKSGNIDEHNKEFILEHQKIESKYYNIMI